MFAPRGFTALSELWKLFLDGSSAELYLAACRFYCSQEFINDGSFGTPHEFGSPLDYIEDVFLASIDDQDLTLCDPSGRMFSIRARAADGFSRWFQKMNVFESTIDAKEHCKTEEGRDWLRRMGSREFQAWPHKMEQAVRWSEAYPIPKEQTNVTRLIKKTRYHTLPVAFERHRYVIPKALPPWCEDPIDVAFFLETVPDFLGWGFCLEGSQADRWRKNIVQNRGYQAFAKGLQIEPPQIGRPRKRDKALEYFDELYPDGNHPSWKKASQEIELRFQLSIAPKTLERVVRERNRQRQIAEQKRAQN